MENKKIIWIAIDLLLLIGVIFVCLYWFDIASDLKAPCYKCSKERPKIEPCLSKPLPKYDNIINFSEIIKEENKNK